MKRPSQAVSSIGLILIIVWWRLHWKTDGEVTLAELKRAEEAQVSQDSSPHPLAALSLELQTAFQAIGRHLPTL